ncbi:hypothetical protein BABINDRAFT_70180 [Babjeviella inositovora NRRL Y-12698]|uniref:Uncharacterized protein n=1 Tax=Babjeviella inositovora NRRL Y-12698 TaxID=984486 RepID=A0A1E3QX85_9ASCO|nr:uncharacterized protein BABINDRAFT_70180 [Babjeviella inositovora NRRL Y-12698]ODQ82276.1 hypothetical protein BABINDRAFT_70180 [Babjeviella inositovora NRRL Y-12698]
MIGAVQKNNLQRMKEWSSSLRVKSPSKTKIDVSSHTDNISRLAPLFFLLKSFSLSKRHVVGDRETRLVLNDSSSVSGLPTRSAPGKLKARLLSRRKRSDDTQSTSQANFPDLTTDSAIDARAKIFLMIFHPEIYWKFHLLILTVLCFTTIIIYLILQSLNHTISETRYVAERGMWAYIAGSMCGNFLSSCVTWPITAASKLIGG